MVGRPKWLDSPMNAGGHGSEGGNAPAACHGAGFPPSPVRSLQDSSPRLRSENMQRLDTYRVRPGGEGTYFVMGHRDGTVEIYGRLTGVKAEERARAIAKDANEGAA